MATKQIHELAPGWLIFRDGCPRGEAPEQLGARNTALFAIVPEESIDVLMTLSIDQI